MVNNNIHWLCRALRWQKLIVHSVSYQKLDKKLWLQLEQQAEWVSLHWQNLLWSFPLGAHLLSLFYSSPVACAIQYNNKYRLPAASAPCKSVFSLPFIVEWRLSPAVGVCGDVWSGKRKCTTVTGAIIARHRSVMHHTSTSFPVHCTL